MAKDTGTISEAAYVKAKQVIAQYNRQKAEKAGSEKLTPFNKTQLLIQLDKWIEDCESQAKFFESEKVPTSEMCCYAMVVAYRNVKKIVDPSKQ